MGIYSMPTYVCGHVHVCVLACVPASFSRCRMCRVARDACQTQRESDGNACALQCCLYKGQMLRISCKRSDGCNSGQWKSAWVAGGGKD